jgi:hypothetical protein
MIDQQHDQHVRDRIYFWINPKSPEPDESTTRWLKKALKRLRRQNAQLNARLEQLLERHARPSPSDDPRELIEPLDPLADLYGELERAHKRVLSKLWCCGELTPEMQRAFTDEQAFVDNGDRRSRGERIPRRASCSRCRVAGAHRLHPRVHRGTRPAVDQYLVGPE